MSNIEDQVADIRERVAGIEAQLGFMQRTLECQGKEKGGGNVIIPVALVITVLEVVKAVVERMT